MAPAERLRLERAVESVRASWWATVAVADAAPVWPRVMTHGSLGSTAVLFSDGQLSALLDVERAANEARLLDLAYTIRGYTRFRDSGALHLGRMTAVMHGYREVEPLPELGFLPVALRVQRLLKIRRKSANFVGSAAVKAMAAKDGEKFIEMLENEVPRLAWLEDHGGEVAEAAVGV